MRKGRDRGKINGKWKIMMFIVATNLVASRPPERLLTAIPTACAKKMTFFQNACILLRAWCTGGYPGYVCEGDDQLAGERYPKC